MKKMRLAIITTFIALSTVASVPVLVQAAPAGDIKQGVTAVGGDQGGSLENSLKVIVNILLFILGAIAVIMIIVGGIRYATSNGEASGIKSAKDTILYSVIGLIVAAMAYAIVNFVLTAFGG